MSRTIIVSNRVPVPSATEAQAGGLAVVLRDLLEKRGYPASDVAAVMHGNWVRFLERVWG